MIRTGADESFRVADIGLVEHVLSLLNDLWCHSVMHHIRCQQLDSTVMVVVVVPGKETLVNASMTRFVACGVSEKDVAIIRRTFAYPCFSL